MNILSIRTRDFKRLHAVQINSDRSMIRITGANGSGKSSFLDSVWVALAGMKVAPVQPIREGADDSEIELKLGDLKTKEVKYIVRRTFARTDAGKVTSTLIVESAVGARFPSPQGIVGSFFNDLTFDPEAFTRMSPKDRLNVLRGMVKLDIDVDTLDAQNRADFENRTIVNRGLKTLKERVDLYAGGVHPDQPVDLIDVSAIAQQIADATAANAQAARWREAVGLAKRDRDKTLREIEFAEEALAKARARLVDEVAAVVKLEGDGEPPTADVADLTRQVQDATKENTSRNLERQQREKLKLAVDEYDQKSKASEEATARINSRNALKERALKEAVYPVQGLRLGEDDVLLNDLPYSQAASGEQLVASFEMAMALNPELKIVRIQNGSLLDSASLGIIHELADARGYQVLIEEVDESGKIGFYLEDGALVAVDGERVGPTEDHLKGAN